MTLSPRQILCLLPLLGALVPLGCGVDSEGRQNPAGVIAVVVCTCAFGLFVLTIPIGIIWLSVRSRKGAPKAPSSVPALRIFISYRRTDSQDVSGRIYDALVSRFEKKNVFKDVDSIPLGKDFRKVLHEAVSKAEVVIVVIGPRWARAANAAGQRRLDDVNDFVRIELETALQCGIPVIPVIVSNAKMVTAAELPASLKDLAFQNGLSVRPDSDFHNDIARLIAALEKLSNGVDG